MDYEVYKQSMTSGQGEAQRRRFKKFVGKSGIIFLVAIQPNAGDNIYCTDSANPEKAGQGFGGGTLRLELEDGTVFELRGGWHTNSGHLLAETGLDLTAQCLTFVVVSEDREGYNPMILKNVLYQDEEPRIGLFERGKEIAQRIANERGKPVCLYSESQGGSSCGFVNPQIHCYSDHNEDIRTKGSCDYCKGVTPEQNHIIRS